MGYWVAHYWKHGREFFTPLYEDFKSSHAWAYKEDWDGDIYLVGMVSPRSVYYPYSFLYLAQETRDERWESVYASCRSTDHNIHGVYEELIEILVQVRYQDELYTSRIVLSGSHIDLYDRSIQDTMDRMVYKIDKMLPT